MTDFEEYIPQSKPHKREKDRSQIARLISFCIVIISPLIINNISFNKDRQDRLTLEVRRDNLLDKEIESHNSPLFKINLLDSVIN